MRRSERDPRKWLRMDSSLAGPALILALYTMSAAQAQVKIDMTKVTCEQFVQYRITNDESVAIWLYGYHSGKRDNTIVDPQKLKVDVSKVRKYCIMNSDVTVIQAVNSVLGAGK